MTLKTQHMPGEPAAPATRSPISNAEASRQLETLLRQYVDRLNETGQVSGARELQNRLSAMTQSQAMTSAARKKSEAAAVTADPAQDASTPNAVTALENRWAEFATYFGQSRQEPQPETAEGRKPQTAAASAPLDFSRVDNERPAASPSRGAQDRPQSAPASAQPQPQWLEQRLNDLESLLRSRPTVSTTELDRRFQEILTRLDHIQKMAVPPGQLAAFDRTLSDVKARVLYTAEQQSAQSEVLLQVGNAVDRLDRASDETRVAIGKAADMTAAALMKVAERTEKAATTAADHAARRGFEATAKYVTEAIRQASPADRFAAIETEVRALNHQSRETGQRAARALEDVHSTLKQFLDKVASGEQGKPAPQSQTDDRDTEGFPDTWSNLPAWKKPVPAAPPFPQYPWEKQAVTQGSARRTLSPAAAADYVEDDDTNGRRLKVGLAVAAVILLLASAGMLYLNVTGKRLPLPVANGTKAAMLTPTREPAVKTAVIAVFTAADYATPEDDTAKSFTGWTATFEPATTLNKGKVPAAASGQKWQASVEALPGQKKPAPELSPASLPPHST